MENLLGLLRIHVTRGIDLAIRDIRSSDPYVVVKMGKQKVYDKDTFSLDDKMGDAEFDIRQFIEVVKMQLDNLPTGTIISKIQPSRENCLAEESCIVWANGKVIQNMFLRLRHVESGEVELQLEWIDIPGSRGM
ncbi:protein C2-DOMAIN ABA-RELATED 4 isoform X2 [Populus trichocarpa]|uniref:protein C2-DOMAIN ABA-RELATED 4 isoform X2 n=1 Tax=Populus trichocarpa TaxID=3694 RepID=UPI002278E4BE|nr:protein C2-DOMAIN ABA-RELATED 4 isoform X2 [Populus trichocarpa]